MSLPFSAALDYANRLYLSNRADFHPPVSKPIIPQWKVEQNQRKAYFDHLHADRMWERRHK